MARAFDSFTTRGSALFAAGVTAIVCGLLLGEVDLVRAGVLAAVIPFVASLIVRRARVQIANRRSVEPERAAAGEAVTVHLVITNHSVLRTGTLKLEDRLPGRLTGRARFVLDPLSGRESRTVSYRMPHLGRGRYRTGPLQIRLGDPFGVIDVTRSFTSTGEFVVTPAVEWLQRGEPARSGELGEGAGSHSIGTHGADDQSTREYRTGDDLRKIHWRSSARTGQLMVRQEERPWRGQDTLLLDLRAAAHATVPDGWSDGETDYRAASSLEWAVSAIASVGSHIQVGGRQLGLIDGTDNRNRLLLPDRTTLVNHLAEVQAGTYPDLGWIAGALRSAALDSTFIAVLGRLDPVSLRTLAEVHPRGRSTPAVAMLLDVDTWAQPDDEPASAAPVAPAQPLDAARSVDIVQSAAMLRAAGWQVTVVRRGETVAQAWSALLERDTRVMSGAVPA